jgi:DnaJ-class molecular chaperone
MTLRGMGMREPTEGSGDLYVYINVKPDKYLSVMAPICTCRSPFRSPRQPLARTSR